MRGAVASDFVLAWRGEAHSTFNPYDINTATPQIIIGAQALHAVGYAMGIQLDGTDQVAAAYFGDGATSQGDVNEAMVFASSFRAPVVFVCTNNQWAISEPVTVQAKFPIAGRAPGFGIPSLRVDGNDVLACLAAMRWAVDHARTGKGPVFIEAVTYRMGPHTTSDDPTRYRDKDEVERWRRRDPLARVEALLRAQGEFSEEFEREVAAEADRWGADVRSACLSARTKEPIEVFDHVYDEPHVGLETAARAVRARTSTASPDAAAGGDGTMTQLTMAKSINEGLRRAMADDPKVLVMGEDIGKLGGVFRVTDGLLDQFGAQRVIDTPLAESGIMGTAVGLAFRGYRPVVEIQFDGFVYPAFDQIVCQVAKLHYRTRGNVKMPITIRIPWAGGVGAAEHHSESPEAYFVHTSGLRVVAVSNPQDAYVMLRQAIASNDPVVYFEPKRLYHQKGEVDLDVDLADAPPMGLARIAREGSDVTLLTYGAQVSTAMDAAIAAEDDGISIEVIDLRSISPVDYRTVAASVRKTGRVVVTHEAAREAGVGAELIASVTEQCFHYLEAPPVRVTGHDIPYPPAKLEKHHLPDLDRILDAVDRVLDRPNRLTGVDA